MFPFRNFPPTDLTLILGSSVCVCVCVCVCVYVCVCSVTFDSAIPWTVAHQDPLSMEFSRQEYLCKLPFPTSEDLPQPGIETASVASPALAGRFFTTVPPGKPKFLVAYTVFGVEPISLPIAVVPIPITTVLNKVGLATLKCH